KDILDTAHPVVVDQRIKTQVQSHDERIEHENGQLYILDNDIGGDAYVEFDIPLWEYDWDHGQRLIEAGLMTHLLTSHCVLELLRRRHGGLVVEVTDGTRKYTADHFRGTVILDLTTTHVDGIR